MRRIWRAMAALGLLLAAAPAFAQVATTGTIEVIVTDPDGGVLPGVTVTASAPDVVSNRTAVTDEQGVATIDLLAPSAQYTVRVELAGFQTKVFEKQLVRTGQTTTLRTSLAIAGVTEQVTVTGETTPVVDITSATTGQDITLQLTESLPTGRSYQSYLQLVPGVLPDNPTTGGNPASRSGLNYSDIGGQIGVSADNLYYFDGINVTDPVSGTFGANLNTEIIQEQKVITGGIPAEYAGATGLISNVVTKSGSNTFSGSANYFFQNSSLVAENENSPGEEFSTRDTAFTFGGPAIRNQAWFFGSYRYLNRKDDVTLLDTNEFMRSVDNTQHQGFAKGTWGPTRNDIVTFTFLNDPTDISGRRERDITNARDRAREQGGNRYSANYNRVFGAALVEVGYFKHNGELSDFSAIREASNDILYTSTDVRTITQEQLGGFGQDIIDQRDTQAFRGSAQYMWKNHTFKGGFEFSQNDNFRDRLYVEGSLYESLAAHHLGRTALDIAGGTGLTWNRLAFDVTNPSDFNGLIRTIDARSDRGRFYDAFDANRDGVISQSELGALLVYNAAASPNGPVFYDRTFQAATGPQETRSRGMSFYAEDTFRYNRLTINAGLRGEQWKHYATTGENIFTFEWEFAPRLSAVYDLLGTGKHKVSAYYGRYYDPVRNNMTNFAGTLTGSILEEQTYVLGEWVTYRTRGGPVQQDAFFAPTTQTPYTDEVQVGYEVDLGNNMSFGTTYYNRRTRDILEDYDLELYATAQDGEIHYPGPIDHPDSLFLGLDYFGYTENPGSNFVIATLAGGERNAQGLELVFRKRFADRWQALASYNWLDAEGNTNSDSNADFQGDVIFLDPRAPNQFGRQPGSIEHLFKTAGSYNFDFGLQLGATFMWNSGTAASRTFLASSRNLPNRVPASEAFEFAGIRERWIAPNTVGALTNPSWATLDLRVQYVRRVGRATMDLFVDLFNVANTQEAIRNQDLVAGQGTTVFGEGIEWVTPRRAFFGARVRF